MKFKIGALLAVAALAVVAAGSARADVPSFPSDYGWCGESTAASCDSSMIYVECADGNVWLVDPAWMDGDSFGQVECGDTYSVLQPPAASTDPTSGGGSDEGTTDAPYSTGGGVDVGFGASGSMAPDPTQYATEVQCPDGSVWAVPFGDQYFTCPAA